MSLSINKKYKLTLLVLLPFIIGFSIEKLLAIGITKDSQIYLSLGGLLLSIWTYGGAIFFWFWVGRIFAGLNISTLKSYIMGNTGFGISFIIYTWQFILLDDTSRNLFIAAISQHYVLGFVGLGTRILGLFTNSLHGNTIILLSYLLMLIVFSLGYQSKWMKL
jgi:hypothetical protein